MSKFSNCSSNWQNAADLSDLVSSGRDRKPEELAFAEECELKSLVFRAERFGLCHYFFFFWLFVSFVSYRLSLHSFLVNV